MQAVTQEERLERYSELQRANRKVDAAHYLTCDIHRQIEELYRKLHDANESLRLAQVERNRCYREYNAIPELVKGEGQQ